MAMDTSRYSPVQRHLLQVLREYIKHGYKLVASSETSATLAKTSAYKPFTAGFFAGLGMRPLVLYAMSQAGKPPETVTLDVASGALTINGEVVPTPIDI